MATVKQLKDTSGDVYPVTKTNAVYNASNQNLDTVLATIPTKNSQLTNDANHITATGSGTTRQLKDTSGNIYPTLATNNVVTGNITDKAVSTAKIADSGVTTAKIADGAVTSAKLNLVSEDFSSKVTFTDTPANADFRKTGNLVTFTFQGSSKTHAANAVAFTLPAGYRPVAMGIGTEQRYRIASANYNETPTRAYINISNGQFIVETADTGTKRLYVQGSFFTA